MSDAPQTENVSDCCHASVKVAGEVTHFYFCNSCGRSCDTTNICGLCGHGGADKVPHPVYWPGETKPTAKYVHAACEEYEAWIAHGRLTLEERTKFLNAL